MSEIRKIITDTRAYSCLDCGRCTVACPVSHHDSNYSPRKLVYEALHGRELSRMSDLWSCLSCAMCQERCQSGVQFTELVRSLRAKAYSLGETGDCTHGGALQSLMHIMTAGKLKQDRLGWVEENLRIASEADTLYFVGCQPYFDIFFSDIGVKTLTTARGAVKILNRLGITPALAPNERCCGHDLLWTGDTRNFIRLAEHNLAEIKKTGAKQVVTTCPECYMTLKVDYPRFLGDTGFEVVHFSQFLASRLDGLKFRRLARKVTYHDPCRLGRFSGIYDEPRTLLSAIPGLELVEMEQNRKNALCCGTQAWINCGTVNKQIQTERLQEAVSTRAKTLLTFCPKCQIHFKCALNDKKLGLEIEIQDVTSLVAKALAD